MKFLREFWAFYYTEKLKSSLNSPSHGKIDDLNDSYIHPAHINIYTYILILAIFIADEWHAAAKRSSCSM
jgi:hypothetical protein